MFYDVNLFVKKTYVDSLTATLFWMIYEISMEIVNA